MRTLSATTALLIGALTLAGCGSSSDADTATGTGVTTSDTLSMATWMEQIYSEAPDTTLGDMILPGTHDSAAYGIDVDAPCDSPPVATASEGLVALASQNPCTAAAMYKAQNLDLGAQLEDGIRYLDLRVSIPDDVPEVTDPSAEPPEFAADIPLVLEHFYSSVPLVDGLNDILAFAAAHPKEQIILDFQHIDLPDTANKAYYFSALESMLTTVSANNSPAVCDLSWNADITGATPATLATGITLGDAWDAGRNLVVLVPADTLAANPCYYPRTDAIISLWPNTEDPAQSVADNANYLNERQQRLNSEPPNCSNGMTDPGQGDNWCGFFVNQMQLTFQPATFVECINAGGETCSLYDYSQQVNNSVPDQISEWVNQGLPVNIVIVDYYEDAEPSYTETLVNLNKDAAAAR